MIWKTHIWGGIQAGIIIASVTNAEPKLAAAEIGVAMLGSILPDIDQPNAKLSRSDMLLTVASKQLSKVTKHRREVHTVWASFLFAIITALFLWLASSTSMTGFSFFVGIIVAIIIDLLGYRIGIPMGIILFFALPFIFKTSIFSFNKELILPLSVAMFFGCIAHLLYDTFNVQGIMWLHPFKKKRYKLGRIQTQSKEESFFFSAYGFNFNAFICDVKTFWQCSNLRIIL